MKNAKNGQKAVMESITRKLEAQSIQVRAAEVPQNGRVAGFTGCCGTLG